MFNKAVERGIDTGRKHHRLRRDRAGFKSVDEKTGIVFDEFEQGVENRMVVVKPRRETLRTHEESLSIPGEIRAKIHSNEFVRREYVLLLANGDSLYPAAFAARIEPVRIDTADGFERNDRNALCPHLLERAEGGDMFAGIFSDGTFDGFHDRREPRLFRYKPLALRNREPARIGAHRKPDRYADNIETGHVADTGNPELPEQFGIEERCVRMR